MPLGDAVGPAPDGEAGAVGGAGATLGAGEGVGVGATTGAASPHPIAMTPTMAIAMSRRARIIPPRWLTLLGRALMRAL